MAPSKYATATSLRPAFATRLQQTARKDGSGRYPGEAGMDTRFFASFNLDVGVGDVLIEPLERIEGKDWLGFAGITKVSLQAISAEQQFAEKLHAYTLPRQTPNSRVRDL